MYHKTWKILTIGTLGDSVSTFKRISDARIKVGHFAKYPLELMQYEKQKNTVEISLASGKSLAMTGNLYSTSVREEGVKQGLKLCPPEVAIQLWLQNADLLSRDESIRIATDTIQGATPGGHNFILTHKWSGHWIKVENTMTDVQPNELFVFVRNDRKF